MPYLNLADAFTETALEKVEKVLVIVVNGQVSPPYPWSISGKEPGASVQTALGAQIPIHELIVPAQKPHVKGTTFR